MSISVSQSLNDCEAAWNLDYSKPYHFLVMKKRLVSLKALSSKKGTSYSLEADSGDSSSDSDTAPDKNEYLATELTVSNA